MKRFFSLLLALAMALALAVPACASHTATKEESAQILYNLGLFKGNGDLPDGTPTFELNRAPTRAEAVIMLIRLLGQEKDALAANCPSPFLDVPDWAAPYIGYAYQNGLAFGIHSTAFGSYDSVTAAQFLTYLLRALGYKDGTDFYWETSYTLADRLGISQGQYGQSAGTFLRGDAALTAANTLFTPRKGSSQTLLNQLTESGAVVLWDCAPTAVRKDYAAFLFYPTTGSSFTSFRLSSVTVNGKSCDLFQLTSPTAVSSYLSTLGYDKTGFCYAELDYSGDTAVPCTTPDGSSYPMLRFSFRYTGVLPNGNVVSGSFTEAYYLDS